MENNVVRQDQLQKKIQELEERLKEQTKATERFMQAVSEFNKLTAALQDLQHSIKNKKDS
jgi:hypothetical protein